MTKTKEDLEQAFSYCHSLVEKIKLKLNINKCEYINNGNNTPITDFLTGETINPIQNAKYLGQIIDNNGNTSNIIEMFNYTTIAKLVTTAAPYISRRAKISLFKTYISSKFTHLLPMISISGNLETTWKNIRKSIFTKVIDFSTMPREAATLIGISYYSMIIKPLLKIYKHYEKYRNKEMTDFLKKSCKKAFMLWITEATEPNNTHPIKILINDLLTHDKFHTFEEYENCIYSEVAKRLYRNKIPPKEVNTLSKLKLPMLIEISSNNTEHIIQEAILQYIIKTKDENLLAKAVTIPITKYVTLLEMGSEQITTPTKPDPNNLNEIIEYNVLYDLQVDIALAKYENKIREEVSKHIKEIINYNKNKNVKEAKIPPDLENTLDMVRNGIPQVAKDKNKAKFFEIILEKVSKYPEFLKQKPKRKVGRPKKNEKSDHYMDIENNTLDKYIIKKQN